MAEPLDWPEDGRTADRSVFVAAVLGLLGTGGAIAAVLVPALSADVDVPADLARFDTLPLAFGGLAYVTNAGTAADLIAATFAARRPEVIVMAFDDWPEAQMIDAALADADGRPTRALLRFDDGLLVETIPPAP